MTGVPSSQVYFNVEIQFTSQKMQLRHPDRCPLIRGKTVGDSQLYGFPIKNKTETWNWGQPIPTIQLVFWY